MSSRSTTHASSPNATAPSDHLLARLLAPPRLLLALCYALASSRLVTPSTRSGLLAQRSWLYPGLTPVFPRDRTASYCGLARPYVRSRCYVECCNGGGAGFDRKASYCSASDCAQVWVSCLHDNARVFALPRRRRQDGWTSTPGACRGTSA